MPKFSRALALCAALVPALALAAAAQPATAMKIVMDGITERDYPSWRPCPYKAGFTATFNVSDYSGTPNQKFVYHWEQVGNVSHKHWRSPDYTMYHDLNNLDGLLKTPGIDPKTVFDEEQTENDTAIGPANKINKTVTFVLTYPVVERMSVQSEGFCHS